MRRPRLPGGRGGALLLALAVIAVAAAATLANLALLDRAANINAPLGELRQAGATAAPATPPAVRTGPSSTAAGRGVPPRSDDSDDRDRDRRDRRDRDRDDRDDRDREDD